MILSCGVYVSRELPVEVRWYWTQDDQLAGISGIWINENSPGHTLQYSPLFQFDSGEFTGLYVDLHSLTILDFNEGNSGYYWCQFLLNGSQLDPSRSGYVAVNDSYSQVCLTNDIRFLSTGTLPAALCAVRLDSQCCTSSLNAAILLTSSTVSHSTSTLDTVDPSAGSIPLTLTASSSTSLYSSVIPSPVLSSEHNETGTSDIPIYIGVGIGSVLAVSLCFVMVLGFMLLERPRRKMRSAVEVAGLCSTLSSMKHQYLSFFLSLVQ